jgi:hypothetical protein
MAYMAVLLGSVALHLLCSAVAPGKPGSFHGEPYLETMNQSLSEKL